MCGIVGYVGQRPVQDLLLAGLEKLEYRGYDSAGLSMISGGEIDSVRPTAGKIGRATRIDDALGRYVEFAKQSFPRGMTLEKMRIAVDVANGAASAAIKSTQARKAGRAC